MTAADPVPQWTHAGLIADLVGDLNGLADYVCSEVKFGAAYNGRVTPIPDVIAIRKSYTRIDVRVFEVKASRGDFLAELRNGKWQDYLPRSTRFYFATAIDGVVRDAKEIPEPAGWIARTPENGWRVVVPPKVRFIEPTYEMVLALLMAESNLRKKSVDEIAALRKTRHGHNVQANQRMRERLKRFESAVKGQWNDRRYLRDARQELEKCLGIELPGYGGWGFAVSSRVKEMTAGLPFARARGVAAVMRQLAEQLESLADAAGVAAD